MRIFVAFLAWTAPASRKANPHCITGRGKGKEIGRKGGGGREGRTEDEQGHEGEEEGILVVPVWRAEGIQLGTGGRNVQLKVLEKGQIGGRIHSEGGGNG